MIKQAFRIHPFCLIGLLLITTAPQILLGQPSPKAKGITSGLHLAVIVQGPVTVQRPGWSARVPVVFGTYLQIGDLLRLDESSHAKVVCSDLTLHDLPPGIVGVPCAGAQPLLRSSDGSLINPTRLAEANASFPIVISPRKTKLLSPLPLLRWTPVLDASGYRVVVRGPNLMWAEEVGSVTQIGYPKFAPALKPGVDYKLIVETSGGTSGNEPGLGLGFSVLNNEERRAVEREQRKIEGLGLPSGPTQFLTAHVYAAHGLNAEAIEQLEITSKSFKVSAVSRALSALYLTVGLTRQAEAAYINFLKLSVDQGDQEGQMLAHLSLGETYSALGDRKLASQHLEACVAVADKLGDRQTAVRAQRQLAELKE